MVSKKHVYVQIIQPLIPEYRIQLFQQLAEHDGLHVKVCASRTLPYKEFPPSSARHETYADLDHSCIGLMGNHFLWQRNMHLDPSMGKGDVLVVCGDLHFLSNIPLIWMAKRKGIGVVWWGHGFTKRRNRLKDILNRIIMNCIDVRLLYTDKEVAEYKQLGYPANKLFATNNTIDQEQIRKAIVAWDWTKLNEFKKRENITEKKVLLFCGRRTKSISLELVFTALAQLRKNNDKYLFIIIGPDNSDGYLGKKAKELGVEDCIRWIGPIYHQILLAPWFLSASCFVFPGSIGLGLIHAFSYGLPVILPDCNHGPEIEAFSDGENGYYYRNGSVEDLAKIISTIVEHPELKQKLSICALHTVENTYTMEAMVNRFLEAIHMAANRYRKI